MPQAGRAPGQCHPLGRPTHGPLAPRTTATRAWAPRPPRRATGTREVPAGHTWEKHQLWGSRPRSRNQNQHHARHGRLWNRPRPPRAWEGKRSSAPPGSTEPPQAPRTFCLFPAGCEDTAETGERGRQQCQKARQPTGPHGSDDTHVPETRRRGAAQRRRQPRHPRHVRGRRPTCTAVGAVTPGGAGSTCRASQAVVPNPGAWGAGRSLSHPRYTGPRGTWGLLVPACGPGCTSAEARLGPQPRLPEASPQPSSEALTAVCPS